MHVHTHHSCTCTNEHTPLMHTYSQTHTHTLIGQNLVLKILSKDTGEQQEVEGYWRESIHGGRKWFC